MKCIKCHENVKIKYLGLENKSSSNNIFQDQEVETIVENACRHHASRSQQMHVDKSNSEKEACYWQDISINTLDQNEKTDSEDSKSFFEYSASKLCTITPNSKKSLNCDTSRISSADLNKTFEYSQSAEHSITQSNENIVSHMNAQKQFMNPGRKLDKLMDTMNENQNEDLQHQMAKAIYVTGCSFNIIQHPEWQKLFEVMSPAFNIPTSSHLSNKLLNDVYDAIDGNVRELVAAVPSVAILCDGWSNVRNKGIINFIVSTPKPVFWRSICTGSEKHTGEYLAKCIADVIEEIGPLKVTGLCTDNASNMKNAWELINEKYPHIYTYGCLAHALNLIFSDLGKVNSVESLIKDATNVVKTVKSSQRLSALLKMNQDAEKTSLKLPVKTRWGHSIVPCLESLTKNKQALKKLSNCEEAQDGNLIDSNKLRNHLQSDVQTFSGQERKNF
ncbi:UNVERIFIED_CONTAM: hypothetical protein GTU68_003358 [Idotea baltica]|nr:hypothetical protein [Idotea baltica]